MNRKVMVSKREKQENHKYHLVEKGEALFHEFGMDYEEFEEGAGNFSTAIVEWPDGKVENVAVENIRFLGGEE